MNSGHSGLSELSAVSLPQADFSLPGIALPVPQRGDSGQEVGVMAELTPFLSYLAKVTDVLCLMPGILRTTVSYYLMNVSGENPVSGAPFQPKKEVLILLLNRRHNDNIKRHTHTHFTHTKP